MINDTNKITNKMVELKTRKEQTWNSFSTLKNVAAQS